MSALFQVMTAKEFERWDNAVGKPAFARLCAYVGVAHLIYNQHDFLDRHYLFTTLKNLRQRLDRNVVDAEMAPLYLIEIGLDAADFTRGGVVNPAPLEVVPPVAANFLPGGLPLPDPPPAVPPVTHPNPPVELEALTWSYRLGRSPSPGTDFKSAAALDINAAGMGVRLDMAGKLDPREDWYFAKKDRRLIMKAAEVLDALGERDALTLDPAPTTKISTRDQVFPSDDPQLQAAVELLRSQLDALLAYVYV